MLKQRGLMVLSIALILSLLVAAVMPFAVLADDLTPPPAATDVPVEPVSTDVPAAKDAPAVPIATDAPAPAVTEVVPLANATPITEPSVLEKLPADTSLVVVDNGGAALPLVSNDAAAVLAAPDPFFTVAGKTYQFTAADCDPLPGAPAPCTDPIQKAIDYLSTTLKATPDDGNIYVQSGAYNEPSGVKIFGSAWTSAGGALPGDLGLVGAGSGSTTINNTLEVKGLSNAFTLSGFTFNDTVSVESSGNVNISDVVVDGSQSTGGINIDTGGNVDLTNVTSTASSTDGVWIGADGNVALNNVVVTDNTYNGASVGASGDIIVNGGNFNDNNQDGLQIFSFGNVTLNDVTATGNGKDPTEPPFFFDGSNGGTVFAPGNTNVNGGNFSYNPSAGLLIFSGQTPFLGSDSVDNFYASQNSGDVNVFGGNFSNNGIIGLEAITSFASYGNTDAAIINNGNITFNHVTALANGWNDEFGDGAGAAAFTDSGNINIICGNYSNNTGYGLGLETNTGNIFLGGPALNGNTIGSYKIFNNGTASFGGGNCGGQGNGRGFKAKNNKPLIPVTGQDCVSSDGERMVTLKAGDAFGLYENLCDVEFQLKELKEDALPGALRSGFTQLDGLEALVVSGGTAVGELPVGGKIILKFPIPTGTDESKLVVLFWNGSAWVEVSGGQVVDGFYVVTVDKPGNYLLAAQ